MVIMEPQETKKKSSKKGWLEDIKGKYSSMMNAGSAKNVNEEKEKKKKEGEGDNSSTSSSSEEGEEEKENKTQKLNEKENKNLGSMNNEEKKTNVESNVNAEEIEKKKGKGKKHSLPEQWNGLHKERREFFEVKKKYYFIEMTKFHQNRENCANNFLDLLERSYDKMLEFLKRGTAEINMLHIFFKELIKNDSTYAKMVTGANSKVNNLTHSFLNLPSDHLLTSQQKPLTSKKSSNEAQTKKTDKSENGYMEKGGESTQGKSTKDNEDCSQPKNRTMNHMKTNKKKDYLEEETAIDNNQNKLESSIALNNIESKETEYVQKKPTIYGLHETNVTKSPSEEFEKTVDEIFNGGLSSASLNHYSITDWIYHSFMNYTKCASNMKMSCEMIDSHIFQNKLFLLKDTYLKEQELLIDGFKRKKYELVKQMELCRYYWKSFENSYMNSDRYKSDENIETKKSKCSWLCQRKYLKNVKLLLLLQKEYIEILCTSIKIFFQLEEWKKNSLRNMLCSYILLYRSFLGFYMNNLNTLYDSLLQEKTIEKAQFDNLNAETLLGDVLRPVEPFTFDENCTTIPRLNYALDIINQNSALFDQNISLKSVLCLFSAPISGYLTSVGIFNKMVEGILVISWDRFIHFFASKEDSSPQWSYSLADIDFKIVKSKRSKKAVSGNKEEGKANTNADGTTTLEEKQKNLTVSLEEGINEKTEKKRQRKRSSVSSASSNASSTKEKEYSQEKEEQLWEICLREKRKTLLISGWSLSFTCATSHLTKVCFELLKNHLNSQCYQKQDPFAHCMELVGSGEITNDLSNSHDFSEFVDICQDLPENISSLHEDKEDSRSQQGNIKDKKENNEKMMDEEKTQQITNKKDMQEKADTVKSKEEMKNERESSKNGLKENVKSREREKEEEEEEESAEDSDSDDDSGSEEDSDESDSDEEDSDDDDDSDEDDSDDDEEDVKMDIQNKKNKIKGNNPIIEGVDIKED